MNDPTAEAVNWALERAATLAEEACPCGVGTKLAAEIRALKVTHEHVDCAFGTPEEMEELEYLEVFAAARGPVAEANLRAIEAAKANLEAVTFFDLAGLQLNQSVNVAAAPDGALKLQEHVHDRKGPMVPVDGAYRLTCSCGAIVA